MATHLKYANLERYMVVIKDLLEPGTTCEKHHFGWYGKGNKRSSSQAMASCLACITR